MPTVPDTMLEEVARRFALLGDPTRLRIVRVLHESGGSTVGEIAAAAPPPRLEPGKQDEQAGPGRP